MKEKIIDNIIKEIINGNLEPGAKISETFYAQKYKTSRTPVREALIELENYLLIKIEKNIGARVRIFKIKEIEELYQLRYHLEQILYLSILNDLNYEKISLLKDLFNKLEKCDYNNKEEVLDINNYFNGVILNLANTNIINNFIKKINILFLYLRNTINWSVTDRWYESIKEHKQLCESLISGDKQKTINLLMIHIDNSKKAFLKYYWKYK